MSWQTRCGLTRITLLAALSVICAAVGTAKTEAISMNPRDYYNGLYNTGVSNSGAKLGGNQADPHWRIVGFFNAGGYASCQRFQNGGGGLTGKIIAPWHGSVAATTVNEYGGGAGYNVDDKTDGSIVGNDSLITPSIFGTSPWGIVKSNARWISHNQFGQHYNSTEDAGGDLDLSIDEETGTTVDQPGEACIDASGVDLHDSSRFDIWAYQTSFNITGDEDIIDYTSIQLNLSAYVDNFIAIQVNGGSVTPPTGNKPTDMARGFVPLYLGNNSTSSGSIWIQPGFSSAAQTVHTVKMDSSAFHYGTNSITVYVKTNYSHQGFMVSDINLTFDFNATVDLQTEIRARDKHNDWSLSDLSRIRPSDQLQWRHSAWQRGPGNTNKTFTFYAEHARNGSTFLNTQIASWSSGKQPSNSWEVLRQEGTGGSNSWYVVQQADVGGKVCGRTRSSRTSNSNSTPKYSNYVCADVPYHYPGCTPGDPDCSDNPPDIPNPNGDCTQNGTCPNVTPDGGTQLRAQSDVGETVMPGERVAFNYTINNSGPTKTKDIEYRVYTFLMPATNDLPENWDHMATYPAGWGYVACGGRDVASNTVDHCEQVLSGWTGSIMPNAIGSNQPYKWQDTVLGKWLGQPGDRICSYITANSDWSVYDGASSNSYAASNIKCVKIGKRPQIQINGSDSYANKGFTSSKYSDIELNYQRGSYSQYGLLTGSGSSSNFGSAGHTFSKSSNASKACQLGWANTSCNNSFSPGGLTHTFYNAVTVTDATSYPGSLSSLSSPSGGGTSYYQASGGTNFSGNLNPGTRAVVYVNGDANITGNIIAYGAAGASGNLPTNPDAGGSTNNLNQTFTNLVDIPSLTIVATGDININGSVTTIDANLVSKNGRVITCAGSDGGGTKTELGIGSTQCANKLKINGAVASKESPILHRIFGAGNTIDTTSNTNQWNNLMNSSSSEWFNYTPNVWLTPYLNGGGDTPNNYTTVQVTNLPARY